jgi:predicted nucleic acid-binding protein
VRYYLDTAPVVYLVERVPELGAQVWARLSADDVEAVASDLTRLECRVKPLRAADPARLADFDAFFAGLVVETVPLARAVIDRATEIRATYGYKTPDAIHLSAALEARCDVFLTNDRRLAGFPDLRVELVGDDVT